VRFIHTIRSSEPAGVEMRGRSFTESKEFRAGLLTVMLALAIMALLSGW
jgi:hypothetical protein